MARSAGLLPIRRVSRRPRVSAHGGIGRSCLGTELDGNPVALEIGFISKSYYSYIGAMDLDYARFSPGQLQLLRPCELLRKA